MPHQRFVLRHNNGVLLFVRDLPVPAPNHFDWVVSLPDETNQEFERDSFGRALQ